MVTILGFLLFFGISATTLWLFNEYLWRSQVLDDFDAFPEQHWFNQSETWEDIQVPGEENPNASCRATLPSLTIHGTAETAENR